MKHRAMVCSKTGEILQVETYSFASDEGADGCFNVPCGEDVDPSTHCYDLNNKTFALKQPVPYKLSGTRVSAPQGTFFLLDAPDGGCCVDGVLDSSGVLYVDVDEPGAYRLTLELAPYQTTEVVIDVC